MAKVALLIGVSEYGEGLNPLPSAIKDVEAILMVGFMGGVMLAITQALILRRYLSRTHWWLASVWGGYIVGLCLFVGMEDIPWWTFGAISGAALGLLQWLILRQQFSKAGWWILGSAEKHPLRFATWVLGETPASVTVLKTELSIEPIRADAVLFLQAVDGIVHLEFQTTWTSNPPMPLRLLDYWARLYRLPISQTVMVLLPPTDDSEIQGVFEVEATPGDQTANYLYPSALRAKFEGFDG